ncbi:MAG TPA: DUF979 domain-containing protein [Gammaproteobacteria bacterium]|nr:DUF979 domain-containing protein [Gammaproteobacteria bacterium]
MIGLDAVYILAGFMFAATAWINFRDRANPKRWKSTLFWGLYAVTFMFGSWLPPFVTGCLAVGMAFTVGIGGLGRHSAPEPDADTRRGSAERFGNRLFIPALMIPVVTFAGTVLFKYLSVGGEFLVSPGDATLVSLCIAVLLALAVALPMLRQTLAAPFTESRRLLNAVGPVAALPQLLAALGVLFAAAGVGHVVSELVGRFIPVSSGFAVVAAYGVGMALFTMVMGNAFAAFPVMTAGIGLPLIVHLHHGNAAIMGAVGMLSGYCGTLMTPMAANFNAVPAALLELPDPNGVIKVQVPTGLMLLVVNISLMYFLVFRF